MNANYAVLRWVVDPRQSLRQWISSEPDGVIHIPRKVRTKLLRDAVGIWRGLTRDQQARMLAEAEDCQVDIILFKADLEEGMIA